MISIQELGLAIMNKQPAKFYVLGGSEYGIKDRYMDILRNHYGNMEEYSSVSELVKSLSVKHWIPLQPALYVVRYDEGFVSTVDANLVAKIRSLKFEGCIFCIYQDPKHISKLDKFFPENTCVIESVDARFISKYLHEDFPKLDDRSIKIAALNSMNYGHARTMCKSLMACSPEILAKMSENKIAEMLGISQTSIESDIQKAVAARNFCSAAALLDKYEGDADGIVYTILQTMIELEKILSSKYSDSLLKEYVKFWKFQDVYNMFMNAYQALSNLRSNTSTDARSSLIYLFGLLTFKDIPSTEVMQSDI